MESLFMEIIGGGILTVMILKEVFAFILRQRNGNGYSKNDKIDIHAIHSMFSSMQNDIDKLKHQTKDLWVWHNIDEPGEPGVKVWYAANRRKTEEALTKIAESMEKQTKILDHMSSDLKDLKRDVGKKN